MHNGNPIIRSGWLHELYLERAGILDEIDRLQKADQTPIVQEFVHAQWNILKLQRNNARCTMGGYMHNGRYIHGGRRLRKGRLYESFPKGSERRFSRSKLA